MPRLSNDQRHRALGMLDVGASVRDVARALNVHHSTVYRLRQRFRDTGRVSDHPRSGAPRITTRQQDQHVRLAHLRNRFQTAASTARATVGQRGDPISNRTVRRRLTERNIRCYRPYVGPVLTLRHRQARYNWAANRAFLGCRRWRDVVFSDESRFCVSNADGRVRVYRRVGERYRNPCVLERNRFGGPSVMVWGAINADFKSELVVIDGNLTAQRYVNEVLRPILLPLLNGHGGRNQMTFQHDNATPHSARLTRQFLADSGVNVMQWPAMSPDMNCIKHLWDILGRRVSQHVPRPETREQLIEVLQHYWNVLPPRDIHALVMSMPQRLRECLAANGGHTRY